MAEAEKILDYLQRAHRRLARLGREVPGTPEAAREVVERLLAETGTALEELRITQDELQTRNDQLSEAQAQLASERRRYQELFDLAPDAYLVTDARGVIVEANRAAAGLLHVRADRLRGKPLALYVAEEERPAFRTWLPRLAEQSRSEEWEFVLQPRKGPPVPVAITIASADDGTNLRWLIRDVSERRRAEENAHRLIREEAAREEAEQRSVEREQLLLREREARAEAERANRVKADFLAVMSHELRTPINAIIGYAELLQMGVPQPIPEPCSRHVERVRFSAWHLLQLIEEILTFARIEAGKSSVHPEPLQVQSFLEATGAMVEPLTHQKGLAFRIDVPRELPTLRTDPGKLRQILLNLLSNAVKFTYRGKIRLSAAAQNDGVLFEVHDTGIGISPEHRERIFDPFWQVEAPQTRRVGGTGLGLSVCRDLAHLLGGTLSLESTPGEGSVFRVWLPLDFQNTAASEAAAA